MHKPNGIASQYVALAVGLGERHGLALLDPSSAFAEDHRQDDISAREAARNLLSWERSDLFTSDMLLNMYGPNGGYGRVPLSQSRLARAMSVAYFNAMFRIIGDN